METLGMKGWTAFTILFGFMFVFIWMVHLMGEMKLFTKIFYTIAGAAISYFVIQAKLGSS